MSASPVPKPSAPGAPRRVQDEWGVFDPEQAGIPALRRSLNREGSARAAATTDGVTEPRDAARAVTCPSCSELLPGGTQQCPRCLRAVASTSSEARDADGTSAEPASKPQTGAIYTLESPVRCSQCDQPIRTFRVIRVLRTQVSFTSTLPRKGYVIACSECEGLLSAVLSGMV